MNELPSNRSTDLLQQMRAHPLGGADAALLETHRFMSVKQAETAFALSFHYGLQFPSCLRAADDTALVIGEAGPALVLPEELAALRAMEPLGRLFIIENQVEAFRSPSEPPIMLEFDSVDALDELNDSEGSIRDKLQTFLVGEYFLFSEDGRIAKYSAFDQAEPAVGIVARPLVGFSPQPWIHAAIAKPWHELLGASERVRTAMQRGEALLSG